MAIVEWAPLNVPLEKRLQTLAVMVQMFTMLAGEPLAVLFVAFCLVNIKYLVYFGQYSPYRMR